MNNFNLVILVVFASIFLSGCEFFALYFAPKKQPVEINS